MLIPPERAGSIALRYDGLGRLRQLTGAGTQRFAYDGLEMIAEYNGADALQRRYVFGPGIDEPLVWYEGSGTSDRRFLHADERGSIVAVSNSSGAMLNINKYDEYGTPGSANAGRFQYTGQAWLSEIGVQYSKARMYDPALGRFLQPDPIGYAGGLNLYAYVLNDPINFIDPLGLCDENNQPSYPGQDCSPIVVTKKLNKPSPGDVNPFFLVLNWRTINFLAGWLGGSSHDYLRHFRITKRNTQCTTEEARAAMLDAAVPGRSGDNVSGQTYDVSWLGSSFFTGPDTIRFRTIGTNGFINETLSNHYFRYGSVVGMLTGDPQSGFILSVRGSGSNINGRGWLNQMFGPEVFRSAARQMNQELLTTCGG